MCRRAAAGLSSPNLVDSHLLVASTRALSDMLMLTASATIFGSAAPLAPCPTFDAGGLSVSTKGDATVIYPSQTGEDVQACVDKHSCIGTVKRECDYNSGNCGQIFREALSSTGKDAWCYANSYPNITFSNARVEPQTVDVNKLCELNRFGGCESGKYGSTICFCPSSEVDECVEQKQAMKYSSTLAAWIAPKGENCKLDEDSVQLTTTALPVTDVTGPCGKPPLADGCSCGHKWDCTSQVCAGFPPKCVAPSPSSPGLAPSSPSSPTSSGDDGTLFVYLEAPGFQVPELMNGGMVPNPHNMEGITTVAVVANAAGAYQKHWEDGNRLFANAQSIDKWLSVCCAEWLVQLQGAFGPDLNVNSHNIAGLAIDLEGGNMEEVTPTFKKLQTNFPSLKLAYTTSPGLPTTDYDYRLGQAYTEGSQAASFSQWYDAKSPGTPNYDHFWEEKSISKGKGDVAMVCGAGNCQEPVSSKDICYDERLSGSQIEKLYQSGPKGDFAVWYGTGQQYYCEPSQSCSSKDEADCNSNSKCTWNEDKAKYGDGSNAVCEFGYQCKSGTCSATNLPWKTCNGAETKYPHPGSKGVCLASSVPPAKWGNQLLPQNGWLQTE